MGFAESMKQLTGRLAERRQYVATEEAVKVALIQPFLQVLGYDVSDPLEVIPEYGAGWSKTAEKIDYALMIGGKPVIFVEAKAVGAALPNHDAQLAKYFNATREVKFAIITDGIDYRFFSDLEEPNMLDKRPFFEFNACSFTDTDIDVVGRFRKEVFNADQLVVYAEELVYLSKLKAGFERLLQDPSDEFIKFAVKNAHLVDSNVTGKIVDRFRPLVKESLSAAVLAIVGRSFQAATSGSDSPPEPTSEARSKAPPSGATLPSGCFHLGLTRSEFKTLATSRKPVAVLTPGGESLGVQSWRDLGVAVVQWLGAHSTLPPLPFCAQKFQVAKCGAAYFLNTAPNHETRPMLRSVEVRAGAATVYLDTNLSATDWLTFLAALITASGEDPSRFRVDLREEADNSGA